MRRKIKNRKLYIAVFSLTGLVVLLFFVTKIQFRYESNAPVKILFVGDMFFDRQIRKVIAERGADQILGCISDFLKEFDLVVGNLEGPITDNPSISLGSEIGSPENFVFTFPPSTAKLLAKNNIRAVSIGNNHIGNFGYEGLTSTRRYLGEAGVDFFGGLEGDEDILRKEVGGVPFVFIAYNQFGGEDPLRVASKIKLERAENQKAKIIVFAHWGEEYVGPTEHMRRSAKLFAESGADLVIGAHPHIIQEQEMFGETPVYYSLGNFVFDQYWNKEVSTGLGVIASFDDQDLKTDTRKFDLRRSGQTCLVE